METKKLKKYISYYRHSRRFYIEGKSGGTVGVNGALKFLRENSDAELCFRGYFNEGMGMLCRKLLEKDKNITKDLIHNAISHGCLSSYILELEEKARPKKEKTFDHISI